MPVETMERKPPVNIELFPEEKKEPPGDIKYICFDKDGTLIYQDFSNNISQYLEEDCGIPYMRSRRLLDEGLHNGLRIAQIIETLFPKLPAVETRQITKTALKRMKNGSPILYPDAYPNLYRLHKDGYRMFISSRDRAINIRREFRYLDELRHPDSDLKMFPGIYNFFEAYIGKAYNKGEQSFRRAAEIMKEPYEEFIEHLLVIGDTPYEGEAAREAHAKGYIARNNHLGKPDYLGNRIRLYDIGPRADLVVDSLDEVTPIIPVLWPKKA